VRDFEVFKLTTLLQNRWLHALLLLMWLIIGTGLRFTHLASKPPWNDEFATLVFSLGNSFHPVRLDQAIALDTLLMPLQPHPDASITTVIHHLMTESTHPPVYFVLTHLWMKLLPQGDEMLSFWVARSLSVIVGAASIPAIFGLGWLAFRSRLVGQMAAAMMAVSPYSIYLAQEARQYTLAILLLIASLCCLVVATRAFNRRITLPLWVGLIWVGVNSLGIAVHYFFSLAVFAEVLVLIGFRGWELRLGINRQTPHSHSRLLYAIAAGTLIGGLVLLPVWQRISKSELTQWIYAGHPLNNWLETIGRFIAWTITMVSLLPVEGTRSIALTSGAVLVIFVLWALPILIRGLMIQIGRPSTRKETQVLDGFILTTIALFFCVTYGLGADLTIAARYQFVYFPAFIVMVGATLAIVWDASTLLAGVELAWTKRQQALLYSLKAKGKKAVGLIWLMGFLGGLSVVSNLAYQKADRPDLLVPIIQQESQVPVLIATTHKNHEQTGKLMGLALEFKRIYRLLEPAATGSLKNPPLFLLDHQATDVKISTDALDRTLTQLPRPLDLWMVNFPAAGEPKVQNCLADSEYRSRVNGYRYRLYHCR